MTEGLTKEQVEELDSFVRELRYTADISGYQLLTTVLEKLASLEASE